MGFGHIRVCVEWIIFVLLFIYTIVFVNFFVGLLVLLVAVTPYLFLGAFESKGAAPGRRELGKRGCLYGITLLVEVAAEYLLKVSGVVAQNASVESGYRNNGCGLLEGEQGVCDVQHSRVEVVTNYVIESVRGFNSPFGLDISAVQYTVAVTALSYVIAIIVIGVVWSMSRVDWRMGR